MINDLSCANSTVFLQAVAAKRFIGEPALALRHASAATQASLGFHCRASNTHDGL